MRLGHVELFVRDPVAARDWYVEVLGAKSVSDQAQFQWIAFGDREILLRPGQPITASSYREASCALVLYVRDTAELAVALAEKGVSVTHGDGDECLTFQDTDGHWIQAVDEE